MLLCQGTRRDDGTTHARAWANDDEGRRRGPRRWRRGLAALSLALAALPASGAGAHDGSQDGGVLTPSGSGLTVTALACESP
jgi:hypothetical protein